ncbi:MAG: hypothetical protein K0R57_453 [Paenibacillaceae bacterium]|jgi:hypothetical protein|nr:hypothetical protein [Paenibacillaceae bacterium]
MKRAITVLSVISAVTTVLSACTGVLYTNGGTRRVVESIHGAKITLWGDGVYANNSLLKTGATKGTDVVLILAAILLIVVTVALKNPRLQLLLRTGLLSIVSYAATCLVMGVSFNSLFLLYVLQFGSSMFAFLLSLHQLILTEPYSNAVYERKFTGTGIFLIISGCSVLMWLTFIIPALLTGKPMETLEIYTTEPTFVLDLAIILPVALFCGIMLLKKRRIGYKMAPVLLTLLTGVGLCVIFQSVYQLSLGLELSPGQLMGLAGTFIILGSIAAVLNIRILRYVK